ncbi:DUF445 family protein [Candidatus Pacearchaeota archaeon]|nr:DUF445 family protein [Candidatus Pacearchaeota archaeon]
MVVESKFIILPLTGAIIGYVTNWVAIKMLFWPRKKIFGIQGLVPKRKEEIAARIGKSSLYFLPEGVDRLTKLPFIGKRVSSYIESGVHKKARSLNDKRLQKIIEETARREFWFIEVSGGVLGFIIGLVQALAV